MSKITIFRGPPGCGKSFEAAIRKSENRGKIAIVERDAIRDDVFGTRTLTKEQEDQVTKVSHNLVRAYLSAGMDVIVSDMNMRDNYVRAFAKIAAEFDAEFEQKIFDTPIEECITRDARRDHQVGEAVIRKVTKNGYPAKVTDVSSLIFDVEPYVQPGIFAPSMVIFDIDGTCAEMQENGRSPYEWHRVGEDSPKEDVLYMATMLGMSNDIVFLSGRNAVCRPQTTEWLDRHYGEKYELFMRKEGDNRPDSIVKYELFNEYIRPRGYSIKGVFDDRDQVVKIWRRMGLTCYQVNYGNF